ncbi:hypothetical protein M3Y97_00136700 [Aphelenchoides bicaudatus]|nr:hypothetical protein M3Y97_00136700 [Aphelenchoides bicaudatus]
MLSISDNYVTFEADGRSHVFFDNICTVRSNGAFGITTKSLKNKEDITFRTRDAGLVNSLNFSTDGQIVGIHRQNAKSVDFVFLDDVQQNVDRVQDYMQKSKNDNSQIKGFEWINNTQVIYITSNSVELYQFNAKKKSVKFIRGEFFEIAGYVYYPPSQLLICLSGITYSIINLFVIQNGVIHRLQRFEADFGCSRHKPKLSEKDVTVASIYGKLYIMVLKYERNEPKVDRLNLYLLNNDGDNAPKLAHSLLLNVDGPVGVHTTTQSFLFDIRLAKPAIEIRPFAATTISIGEDLIKAVYDTNDIILYKQRWALFTPNFLADARFGIFSQLQLVIDKAPEYIEDKILLLEFISNRSNSKNLYLQTLKDLLATKALTVRDTAQVFRIVDIPGTAFITTKEPSYKFRLVTEPFQPLRIDYDSIIQSVLFNLKDNPQVDMHFLSAITLEFLLVLRQSETNINLDLLTELLLHALVNAGEFSKLKQLLQYRVLDDSKLLPMDLMTLSDKHKEFEQIAVDILHRQGKMRQIAEHRLSQGRLVDALRCLKDQRIELPLCLRILETAWASNSRQTKYMAYTTLKDVRRLSCFETQNDQLEKYTKEFKSLFNEEEIEEAEQRFRLAAIGGSSASISAMNSSSIDLDESHECSSVHSEEQPFDMNVLPGAGHVS